MATSFWTELEGFFTTTEADVVALIGKIKSDVAIAENEINGALRWVANQAPTIAADVQQVAGLLSTLGVMNPEVSAAITAANVAVVGINAFAAAMKNGQGTVSSVVQGYVAVKSATAATASAAVAVAKAAPAAPAKAA